MTHLNPSKDYSSTIFVIGSKSTYRGGGKQIICRYVLRKDAIRHVDA